jgi:hypothetical protein
MPIIRRSSMNDDDDKLPDTRPAVTGNAPGAPDDPNRRLALRKLGGYAMSVAPAMILLTQGRGRGNGGGNGDPQAPCDNPAWDLGLKRAGHSGC